VAIQLHWSIIKWFAPFLGTNASDKIITCPILSINSASTVYQQCINRASTVSQQSINSTSTERQQSVNRALTERQQCVNWASTERQQSVNRVSAMFNLASCIINPQWNAHNLQSTYRQLLVANMPATMLHPPPRVERPQFIDSFVEAQNATQQWTALYWS